MGSQIINETPCTVGVQPRQHSLVQSGSACWFKIFILFFFVIQNFEIPYFVKTRESPFTSLSRDNAGCRSLILPFQTNWACKKKKKKKKNFLSLVKYSEPVLLRRRHLWRVTCVYPREYKGAIMPHALKAILYE